MRLSGVQTNSTLKTKAGRRAVFEREFDLLLAAARTTPDAARIDALAAGGVDWRALLDLATVHGVRPLVYKSLHETCWERIPADVQSAWDEVQRMITGRNLFLTGELLRVTDELGKAGLSVAAMKGAVIAQMAYDDFTLREFSDIDLLVRPGDFSRAVDLIARLGYRPVWKYEYEKTFRFLRHVGEYTLRSDFTDADIDLHWRVATKATALSPSLSDFPTGFQPLSIAGSTVLTFAPQDLPLYLAAQGGWDRWADLRRISDLAEFLRRYPEVDWEPHFQTARRLGGLRSMWTGLALAHQLLGAALPGSAVGHIQADTTMRGLIERTTRELRQQQSSGEAARRYLFQMRAKKGLPGKTALAWSILTDRTAKDGLWLMLPPALWWLYPVLRPLRMGRKRLWGG
ncbi:MAG: nucleotidyltransferase family protein [Acidobacteriaceae bacterium]